MSDKKSFAAKLERFISGRGFYIVLFAALAVIGVTAWIAFASAEPNEDDYSPIINPVPDHNNEASVPGPGLDPTLGGDADGDAPVMNPVEVPDEPDPGEGNTPDPQDGETGMPQPGDSLPVEGKNNGDTEVGGDAEPVISISDLVFSIPVAGNVSAVYSPDALVYSKTMGDWRVHEGIDIAAPMGTQVRAVAQGTVASVEADDLMGTVIKIDHGQGLTSIYANLAGTPTVKAGDKVTVGAVIGSVGDTALGEIGEVSHLHFAMELNGEPVDPYDYIPS